MSDGQLFVIVVQAAFSGSPVRSGFGSSGTDAVGPVPDGCQARFLTIDWKTIWPLFCHWNSNFCGHMYAKESHLNDVK